VYRFLDRRVRRFKGNRLVSYKGRGVSKGDGEKKGGEFVKGWGRLALGRKETGCDRRERSLIGYRVGGRGKTVDCGS